MSCKNFVNFFSQNRDRVQTQLGTSFEEDDVFCISPRLEKCVEGAKNRNDLEMCWGEFCYQNSRQVDIFCDIDALRECVFESPDSSFKQIWENCQKTPLPRDSKRMICMPIKGFVPKLSKVLLSKSEEIKIKNQRLALNINKLLNQKGFMHLKLVLTHACLAWKKSYPIVSTNEQTDNLFLAPEQPFWVQEVTENGGQIFLNIKYKYKAKFTQGSMMLSTETSENQIQNSELYRLSSSMCESLGE